MSDDIDRATPQKDWTLTDWEWLGLRKPINVADGHAHFDLAARFPAEFARIAEMAQHLESLDQSTSERVFLETMSALSGQSMGAVPVQFHYSSSVSIEIVAKMLKELGVERVGLVTPTFDNIPLLFRRAGLTLVPVREQLLWGHGPERQALLRQCDALFVVTPNNPSGYCPTDEELTRLMTECGRDGRLLMCDFSFRLYASLHTWDQHARAHRVPGLRFVFIEDTGKVYPLSELKVGFTCASDDLVPRLTALSNELLLNVSPFTLLALTHVMSADLARHGGAAQRRLTAARIADGNRATLTRGLAGLADIVSVGEGSLSVAWLTLHDHDASAMCERWASLGLAVLPGAPFHWDDPAHGARRLRIALAREPAHFQRVPELLRMTLAGATDAST
ncbi:aminotransferase class I/II-fold pyridoxal phosphate-dependent enzyme [Streptomyces sp. NPDC020298]|uniref:aminotransferase class I/II-fold pyridoxal phosphate-dependent enzyme n=1 Tax=unclassified Streptomyces TaxID=2593676 RepID=UPI0033FCF749